MTLAPSVRPARVGAILYPDLVDGKSELRKKLYILPDIRHVIDCCATFRSLPAPVAQAGRRQPANLCLLTGCHYGHYDHQLKYIPTVAVNPPTHHLAHRACEGTLSLHSTWPQKWKSIPLRPRRQPQAQVRVRRLRRTRTSRDLK